MAHLDVSTHFAPTSPKSTDEMYACEKYGPSIGNQPGGLELALMTPAEICTAPQAWPNCRIQAGARTLQARHSRKERPFT